MMLDPTNPNTWSWGGTVYLLRSGDFLKVGFTKNVYRRMSAYETHNPNLELLSLREAGQYHEWRIHKKFEADRIRGEWFRYNEDIIREFGADWDDVQEYDFSRIKPISDARQMSFGVPKKPEYCGHLAPGYAPMITEREVNEIALGLFEQFTGNKPALVSSTK